MNPDLTAARMLFRPLMLRGFRIEDLVPSRRLIARSSRAYRMSMVWVRRLSVGSGRSCIKHHCLTAPQQPTMEPALLGPRMTM